MLIRFVTEDFDRSKLLMSYLDPGSISLLLAAVASAVTTSIVFLRLKIEKLMRLLGRFFKRH